MKKSLILFGILSIGFTHAQQQGREHNQHNGAMKRVGINTEKPAASFEISKINGVPTTQVQGLLIPHLSQTERNAMQKEALTNGLMIFNTSKNCIDWWDGTNWQCTDSSQKDEHGDEYAKYRATFPYTATKTFTRNNCTAEQEAGTISYTNPTPIVGKATSHVSQAEADRLARENAIAEFERLGQEEANRRGTCKEDVFAVCRRVLGDLNYDFAIAGGNASFSDVNHRTLLAKGINQPISWNKLREMWNEVPKGSYSFYIRTPDDGTSSSVRFVATVGDEYWIDNAIKWVGFDNVKEGYAIRTHLGAAIFQSGPPMTGDNATWKCQVIK